MHSKLHPFVRFQEITWGMDFILNALNYILNYILNWAWLNCKGILKAFFLLFFAVINLIMVKTLNIAVRKIRFRYSIYKIVLCTMCNNVQQCATMCNRLLNSWFDIVSSKNLTGDRPIDILSNGNFIKLKLQISNLLWISISYCIIILTKNKMRISIPS